MRKNLVRHELDESVKLLMTSDGSSLSLQNLSEASSKTHGNSHYENVNSRQQSTIYESNNHRKSMPNLQDASNVWPQAGGISATSKFHYSSGLNSSSSEIHLNHSNLVPKPYQPPTTLAHHHHYSNMTRQALMQISAVPKPKLTNEWVQFEKSEAASKPSINSHWLIQEAEQRRIDQFNRGQTIGMNNENKKPLPASVIQTLTQRVQNMGLGVNVNKR